MDNKCVCCDEIIPEGRQVCPSCENNRTKHKKKLIYGDDLFDVLRDDINISGSNLAKVRRHIAEAPAVDAVEAVHARWENIRNFGGGECFGWCSHCKTPVKADNATGLVQNNRLCHWCGAKMDGGNDNGC